MKVLGSLLLAIGLLHGVALGVALLGAPSARLGPAEQSAVVDGGVFAFLGTGLLLLDSLFQRKLPPEDRQE